MVYDWASLDSMTRPLFEECGEELGLELDIMLMVCDWAYRDSITRPLFEENRDELQLSKK